MQIRLLAQKVRQGLELLRSLGSSLVVWNMRNLHTFHFIVI